MKNRRKLILCNNLGVTLLYAIIILGAIAIISLAVAGLTIRGLKQARDIGRGMTAYYAAETGLEEALYNVKVRDDASDGSGSLDLIDGGWDYDIEDSFDRNNPYAQSILLQDETIEFDNIGTSTRLHLGWSDGDGSTDEIVEVTYVGWEDDFGNFGLDADYHQVEQRVYKEIYDYGDLSGGWVSLNLSEANNLVRIKPLQDSIADVQIYFDGFDIEDKVKITSVGTHLGYKKALEASFSTDDTGVVGGFFDYVIFSQQGLSK